MNKLRVLSDNFSMGLNTQVTSTIYRMQRLYVASNVFIVGDIVTDGVTGGAIVLHIGSLINLVAGSQFFIDILLVDDTLLLVPNPDVTTPTIISNGTLSTTATLGERIISNYPGFTSANLLDNNRNRILTAQNSIEDKLLSYKSLTTTIYKNGSNISNVINSMAILNHNLSDTAIVTIRLLNGVTVLGTETISVINRNMFSVNTHYYNIHGNTKFTEEDKANRYNDKNIIKYYFTASYNNVTTIQIDIFDNNNSNNYIFIGNVYLGQFYEVNRNMRDNWFMQTVDTSVTTYAQSPFSVEKDPYDVLALSFSNITSDEKQFWLDLFRKNGTFNDIIFDLFNDSPDPNNNIYLIYGRFRGKSFKILNNFLDKFSLQFQIRESI